MPSSGVKTCALRSEEHTSELQSHDNLVCRLLLDKNIRITTIRRSPTYSLFLHRGALHRRPRSSPPQYRVLRVILDRALSCPLLPFFFLKLRGPPSLPPFPHPPPPRC